MKNKFRFLLILLAAAGVAATVNAADEPEASGPETVIVPFDATKPIDSQKLDKLYVPYERFLELWELAKANKRGLPPENVQQTYVLSSARYDAKLDDGALHVTGAIDLQTFTDDWVSVPLAFRDVKLGVLKLDGQPAPLAANGVAIEKAGHHRIDVEFDIPFGSNITRVAWGIPKTAGTLFSITLPDKQMKAAVHPGNGVVERINGDQKIVTAALGSTDNIELLLDSSVGLSTITQAAVAKINTMLNITPAVELVQTGFEFSFPESQQDHFTVSLDKALALVKLDVPNLKSWKLTVGADSQSLEIVLVEPARGSFKFSVDAERSLTELQRKFPYISAAANRVEQTSALFSTPFLDVTPQPTAALRQISYSQEQNAGLRLVAAFSSTGDKEQLAYGVQPAKISNKAEISYVYLVNHSKIELVAALKLRVKDATLFDVTLGLPGDFVVQAVESDRLKDWWREGDVLHVRFKGNALDAVTPLVLHLVKLYKAIPDALEIKPLTLPDAWEVEGNGIVAASTSVQAQMTLAGAKEINPQNAATDFRILPPMERKRGFSFKGQDFHASVTLETLPPRVDGTWVMSAQAHENWVSVSTHVNLSARQGSAPGASFRLPASTPEARVTGGNVRETTSAVQGNWRVYQVAFQNDLTDTTDFTVDFDLPGDGGVSLPSFEFLDVERAEGFVIVDNVSEYKMEVNPAGLEVALSEQIPFLPLVSRNASLFRAVPGWTLQINLTRLEKEAGRSAFVEWAELTTAIRADGSEWHRASYHLQNRSLQFLPVKLPDGSELASVSVAGENVRADRGKVDGKDVLLVPLIKTKPGDASYDVNLVYRKTKAGGLWTFSHESLADPEVVGITVERTLWNLYVPEGSDAGHFGGNMEQVLDEVNQTEKLEGMLEELKSLNSVVLNGGSLDVTRNAGENFKKLAKSVEDASKLADMEKPSAAVAKDAYQKQSSDVALKKQEIQKELADERQAFEGNIAQAQVQVRQANPAAAAADQPQAKTQYLRQEWVNNGSYKPEEKEGDLSVDKAKSIDRQNVQQAGKQIYVNDYVVNVQDGGAVSGVVTQSGSSAYTGATTITAGASNVAVLDSGVAGLAVGGNSGTSIESKFVEIQGQQAAQRAPQAVMQNAPAARVVLNNAGTVAFAGVVGGAGQVTTGLRSGGEAITNNAIDNLLNSTAASTSPNAALANTVPLTANSSGNVTVLSAARANTDTNSVTAQQDYAQPAVPDAEKSGEAMNAPLLPGAGGAGALGNFAQAQQAQAAGANAAGDLVHGDETSEDMAEEASVQGQGEGQGAGGHALDVNGQTTTYYSRGILQSVGGGFGGGGGAGGTALALPPAQLQPAGSISLPIDFPTDGYHVYHFKKLKANATLSFWITNANGLDKWKWLVVFLVAAALIQAGWMVIDRGYLRVFRRRIVHI